MVSRNFAYWNYYCLFLRDNNEMSYAFLHVYSTLTSSIFNSQAQVVVAGRSSLIDLLIEALSTNKLSTCELKINEVKLK